MLFIKKQTICRWLFFWQKYPISLANTKLTCLDNVLTVGNVTNVTVY